MDLLHHYKHTGFILIIFAVTLGYDNKVAAAVQDRFNLQQQNARPPTPPFPERFNFFDTDLLRNTARTVKGNFMISPASIKSTLAMLLEGASGNCADELRQTLRLPEDKELLRQQFNNYLSSLQVNTPGVTLRNANRIFLSNKLTPKQEYRDLLKSVYWSDVQQVDFTQVQNAVDSVNNWVSDATNRYIPFLVTPESVEVDTVMILANAIYFKGVWKTAFNPEDTAPKCFKTEAGCRTVNMMELQDEFNYGVIDDLDARVVEIPYNGDTHSMLILLPNEKMGLAPLIKDISQVPVNKIIADMQLTDVQLSLPKFTINFEDNMVAILRSVGVQKVFESETANFTAMLDETRRPAQTPQLNNVFHKTYIQVDESGSIASAATGAMVVPLMGSTTAVMSIDHPFLFIIRDRKTGAILFQGRVEEPDLANNAQLPQSPQNSLGQTPDVISEVFDTQSQPNQPTQGNTYKSQAYPETNSNRFLPSEDQSAFKIVQHRVLPLTPVNTYSNSNTQTQDQRQQQQQSEQQRLEQQRIFDQQRYLQQQQQRQQQQQQQYGKQSDPVRSPVVVVVQPQSQPQQSSQSQSQSPMHVESYRQASYKPYYQQDDTYRNSQDRAYSAVSNPQTSADYSSYSTEDRHYLQRRRVATDSIPAARSLQHSAIYQSPMPKDKDGIVFYEKH